MLTNKRKHQEIGIFSFTTNCGYLPVWIWYTESPMHDLWTIHTLRREKQVSKQSSGFGKIPEGPNSVLFRVDFWYLVTVRSPISSRRDLSKFTIVFRLLLQVSRWHAKLALSFAPLDCVRSSYKTHWPLFHHLKRKPLDRLSAEIES